MSFRKLSKLATFALGATMALGLSGCRNETIYEGKYEGNRVMVRRGTDSSRFLNIYAQGWAGGLNAKDFEGDDRFDEINVDVAKGCPLEVYANIDKLEEIADSVEKPANRK